MGRSLLTEGPNSSRFNYLPLRAPLRTRGLIFENFEGVARPMEQGTPMASPGQCSMFLRGSIVGVHRGPTWIQNGETTCLDERLF